MSIATSTITANVPGPFNCSLSGNTNDQYIIVRPEATRDAGGYTSATLLAPLASHEPTPPTICDMGDLMTPDQRAAFLEVFVSVADGAKIVRYANLASVSKPLSTNKSSPHHPAVAHCCL